MSANALIRYRVTVFDRVNSQCRNHTGAQAPHVHTVKIRCIEWPDAPTFPRDTCFR